MRNTLIDSGPLVAFLDRRDQWREWAAAEFQKATDAFQTCDAVLTEACFLLSGVSGAVGRLQQLIKEQALQSVFFSGPEACSLLSLMERYASVPMSFADACLVRMSELLPGSTVFTTDSDFRIYRRNRRQIIPILCPD